MLFISLHHFSLTYMLHTASESGSVFFWSAGSPKWIPTSTIKTDFFPLGFVTVIRPAVHNDADVILLTCGIDYGQCSYNVMRFLDWKAQAGCYWAYPNYFSRSLMRGGQWKLFTGMATPMIYFHSELFLIWKNNGLFLLVSFLIMYNMF